MFGAVAVNEEPASLGEYARAIEQDVLAMPGVARVRKGLWRRLLGAPAVRVRMDGRRRLFVNLRLVLHFGAPAPETGFETIAVVRQTLARIAGDREIGTIEVRIAGFDLNRFDRDSL